VRTLYINLAEFREYDKILNEIYGYTDPVYNFIYLDDIIVTLDNMVAEAATSGDSEYILMIADAMNQNCFDKIQATVDTIFTDIQNKRLDYIQVKKDNVDVSLDLQYHQQNL
jgi:hypothetical protein